MSYLRFEKRPPRPDRKTDVWYVESTSGSQLGEVRWFSRWRQYTFFPDEGTVFNPDCLRELAEFVADCTRKYWAGHP